MKRPGLLLLVCCICGFASFAQDRQLISGNFDGYRFSQLVREIENQTRYHIYYDSADVDSLEIHLNASELTISELFDSVFKNTQIRYSLGPENQVFVTKQFTIQPALPKNFFNANITDTAQGALLA